MNDFSIKDLKKILVRFAVLTDACEESIQEIKNIESLKGFALFLDSYNNSIIDRMELSYGYGNTLSVETIKEFIDSPFISDYDKKIVLEYINGKIK